MPQTRRESALTLAEELLDDIELSRMPSPEVLKKTSRLARLLDDTDATEWLSFEMHGYPSPLTTAASVAARRSNRQAPPKDNGKSMWWTDSISHIEANVEVRTIQLRAAQDGAISISSANPNQWVAAPEGNTVERGQVSKYIADQRALAGKIIGAFHAYVAERAIELRFGAAVESAFTLVRNEVDAQIAGLVPAAATQLSAAFENASSGNPEHWASAAAACRRLLKTVADELRPIGEDVNGRAMGDGNYINRLVDWIAGQQVSGTLRDVITSDLEDFGKRIDAFSDAGNKGAHADVSQYEASRFITGAYLLIGDILRIRADVVGDLPSTDAAAESAIAESSDAISDSPVPAPEEEG